MEITPEFIDLIKSAMARKNQEGKKRMNRSEFAAMLDRDRSWATRFFDLEIKTISTERARMIERALDIRFMSSQQANEPGWSSAAAEAAHMTDNDPNFRNIVESYYHSHHGHTIPRHPAAPPTEDEQSTPPNT